MEPIIKYFSAEKSESILFIVIGIIAIALSIYFQFFQKDSFYRGMILPLVGIGFIQIVVGSTVFFRSPKDIKTAQTYLEDSTQILKEKELPRMDTVMKNFKTYKWVEIAFILIGVGLLIYFKTNTYGAGLGVGMLFQGTAMLILDIFAERRGIEYIDWIQQL